MEVVCIADTELSYLEWKNLGGETNCSRIWTVLSGRSTVADRPAMKLPNRAMPAMIAGGKIIFGASPRALASRLSYWRRPPFGTTRGPFRNSGRPLCPTRTARPSCTCHPENKWIFGRCTKEELDQMNEESGNGKRSGKRQEGCRYAPQYCA
jgi:hypothetical protein